MSETPETPRGALERRLERLPQELPPARDLWPEIEARLRGQRVRWRLGIGVAAGIAALAILAVIGLGSSRTPRDATALTVPRPTGSANAGAGAATHAPDATTSAATSAAHDAAYLRTQAAVERSFEQELAHLPKATQVRLRQDLEIIRNARADIRRALDAAPENPLLQQLFADTWQQEMDFYSSVASTNNPAGVSWPM